MRRNIKRVLITGGAGFIGSALIRFLMNKTKISVLNIDKLTYAGNLRSLDSISSNDKYQFKKIDICNKTEIKNAIKEFKPNAIMNLAAESHVDRSIDGPLDFIKTNIQGTAVLLECARDYYNSLSSKDKQEFIFHQISTDEVYGSLGSKGLFDEKSTYDPSSPYSASKASADHLVRSWHKTFGLPVLLTNCSNNYGPFQFPEKLIPLMILNALKGKPLTIYGKGEQIRDWLYVDDHAIALYNVILKGINGQTYNIGGNNEYTNLEIVKTICSKLDNKIVDKPKGIRKFEELILFVDDRPGHDYRYAIDAKKIRLEIGWKPNENFLSGIEKTIDWYLNNNSWCEKVMKDSYDGSRLGNI